MKWLAKREAELLPIGYFMLTYMIPSELKHLFLANKSNCYILLFKAISWTQMAAVENNNRSFHGIAGIFAVLHTWDQRLNFYPLLHVVIPSGFLSEDKTQWNPWKKSFLLPVRKFSVDFRDKLLFILRKEERDNSIKIPDSIGDLKNLFQKLKEIPW